MKGLYIHIPFCKSKCFYCDFFSFIKSKKTIMLYIEALKNEIKFKKNMNFEFDTIYIGGGTPSILEIEQIKDIFFYLNKYLIKKEIEEITIEANPESLNFDKLKCYYDLGINRISIGVQTFIKKYLKKLGRTSTFRQIKKAIENSQKIGFKNINLDLIYGFPKQTKKDLLKDLNNFLNLNVNHISYYGLIIEKNTFLYNQIKEGKIKQQNEEDLLKMRKIINKTLKKNGFNRYEISNYSKKKYESKHNLIYWNHDEYISIGANASNFIKKTRWQNQICLDKYIEEGLGKKFKKINNYKIDKKEYIFEALMLKLRLIKGFDILEFNKKYKTDIIKLYNKEIDKLIKEKCIKIKKGIISFTEKGINISNYCLKLLL